MASSEAGDRLAGLAARHHLDRRPTLQLARLLRLLSSDPLAPTAIRDQRAVLEDHLADSLVALECDAVCGAQDVLDLGSGAGLPGLPLAIAMPGVRFTLLESSARKCRFLEQAIAWCEVGNAAVVHDRAESFAAGRGRYDIVTARAVAAPSVTAEYGAPLLRLGGLLLIWRGQRDPGAEVALHGAARQLGLEDPSIQAVEPYPGARHRHLYALRKGSETPPRFPRRPGRALKRPLGAEKHP